MALEDVQMKQFVSNHSSGLLMPISESGSNLSVGQCQLICIAQAILKGSQIVLIDEGRKDRPSHSRSVFEEISGSNSFDYCSSIRDNSSM